MLFVLDALLRYYKHIWLHIKASEDYCETQQSRYVKEDSAKCE